MCVCVCVCVLFASVRACVFPTAIVEPSAQVDEYFASVRDTSKQIKIWAPSFQKLPLFHKSAGQGCPALVTEKCQTLNSVFKNAKFWIFLYKLL